MEYALGVDLGGRTPALAVDRGDGAVADLLDDGPTGLDRLLDDLGDPFRDGHTGDGPAPAARLASLVMDAVTRVLERERATLSGLVVTHPAVWGPYRTDLLRTALDRAVLERAAPDRALLGRAVPGRGGPGQAADHAVDRGGSGTRVVPDALALAAEAGPDGPAVVAVLDVREDGLTVSVVRLPGDGGPGVLLGLSRTVPDLGAADVPDAVLAHVRDVARGAGGPATGSEAAHTAARRLRAECERVGALLLDGSPGALSADPLAPGREVRMVPSELDARLRPRAARAVAAAADAVARTTPDGVDVVLVAGRLGAHPLVTELVSARFDAPLVVVRDGGHAAARGAVALARRLPPSAPHDPDGLPRAVGEAPGAVSRRDRRTRARGLRRRDARPLRVAAVAGTGALLLGVVAVAVSEDAFAEGPPTQHIVSVPGPSAP